MLESPFERIAWTARTTRRLDTDDDRRCNCWWLTFGGERRKLSGYERVRHAIWPERSSDVFQGCDS